MKNFTLPRSYFLKGGYFAGIRLVCLLLFLCNFNVASFAQNTSVFSTVPTVAAGAICNGTAAAVPIAAFANTEAGTAAVATQFMFTTTGTYTTADVSSFGLYSYTSNTWPGTGTATLVGSVTATAAGTQTMSVTYVASAGSTYFFIVANTTATATPGHTIKVSTITHTATVPFTFTVPPTCSGSASSAGVFTFATTPATISGSSSFCAPVTTTLLAQDFNFNGGLTGQIGGTWTVVNTGINSGSSYNWKITTGPYPIQTTASGLVDSNVTGDGSPYMNADDYDAPFHTASQLQTQLISPAFSTVGLTSATLAFNGFMDVQPSTDSIAEIDYSTDSATWTSVYNYKAVGTIITGAYTWRAGSPNQTLALPAGATGQPKVYLRWYYCAKSGYSWIVDNVMVTGTGPSTATLTDAVTGGTWSSSATSVATVSTGGVVTGLSAGTTTITYANACGSQTLAETLNGIPTGTVNGTYTVCPGNTTTLSNGVSGGTWVSATTSIASVSSGGAVYGVSAGTANISYVVTNGCGTAYTYSAVTVYPGANAGTISGTYTVCAGSATTLTDAATGGTWSSSATSIATVSTGGIVTGIAAGTANISYTVIGNCNTAITYSVVTVKALPSPGTISGTYTVCAGSTTTLSDGASGGTWSSSATGTATVSTGGAVYGVASGTSNISYTVNSSGCTAFTYSVVTVKPLPSPGTISGTYTVCMGSTTTLSDGTTGGTWSSSATSIATVNTGGAVYGVASGTSNISYTVNSSGCTTSTYSVVTVKPVPSTGFYTGTYTVCVGGTTTLSDNITGGTWSSGSTGIATVSTGGAVYGVAAGASNISYTVNSSGCIASTYSVVTVNALPSPGTISGTYSVCAGSTTALSDGTTGGTWSSSVTSIATVNTGGAVYGKAAGTSNISYTVSSGGCTASTYSVVTVNALPATGTISGTYTVCADGTTTLSNGTTGGTWSSSATGIATVNTGGAVYGVAAGTTNISYTVNNGCTASTYSVVTVKPLPSTGTISGTYTVCPGNATTLSDGASGGTWSSSATTIATVSTGGAVYGVATGTSNISYTVSSSGCTAATYSVVTVNPLPSAGSISGTYTVCPGSTTTLNDGVAGGTWSSSATGVATVSTGGTVYGVAAGTANISYAVTNNCATATAYTAMSVTSYQQWLGASSTAWSNTANWACGTVPTATQDVIIPGASSYSFAPALDVSTGYARKLTINSTAILTIPGSDQLNIAGNIVNNGTIAGAGIAYLNGTTAQALSGNGTISNLTDINSSGVSINSSADTVGITGTLLLSAGTFSTSGTLVLVSNTSGNGSIGAIAGGAHLSGNVVIQQYVPGGKRAFRFIGHPFTTPIVLSQIEPYVDITGAGGATNGFTTTISNAPSAFWYNPLVGNSALGNDPGWTAYTNISGTINQYEGIRLYFRGVKGLGLTGATYTILPTTYRTYGTVNTGTQNIPLTKGTGANEDYNLIGNPYPSALDLGTVLNNAGTLLTGAYFYVWNPYMSTNGQFEAKAINSTYYIAANESFEIRTTTNGNVLTVAESNKVSGTPTEILMRNATTGNGTPTLNLNIYDNNNLLWDELLINFNEAATDNEDTRYDGAKPPSPASLNFYSWSADHVRLAADARPFTAGKVIPLGISSSYAQEFIIRADNVSVPNNGQVYLHDKYLQTYTLLQQGTAYRFSITKDSASQGDQRFELRLNPASKIQVNDLDVQMVPNPASSIVTISYAAPTTEQTTIRVMNVEGITVLAQDLGKQQNGSTQILLDKLASGVYLVEFTSGTNKVVHRLVKE